MPDLFEKIVLLKESDIFREINTDDLRLVADVLEEEHFFAGDIIFEINDYGDQMYLIIEGRIGVTLGKADSENYVSTFGPGECFGEMNLLDDLPRSATAVVLEETKVLKLGKQKLRGLMLSYPELAIGMLKALSIRLRKTTNMINKD